MIEEILGLREYQIKKADAERRLKNSRINLDKTKALIEEILPHLRSLKRQTSRWERRGELETELRGLEEQFFGFQLKELSVKEKTVTEKIAAARSEFDALEKARKEAEARQAKIEASQPEEKKGLATIKADIQVLVEKRSVIQKDLGRLEAQIELAQAPAGVIGAHSAERLVNAIQKIKIELERALQEEELELRATIESVLEELDAALDEGRDKKPSGARGGGENLRPQFEKLSRDLASLEKNIGELRLKERSFEQSQEGFYVTFKAAVADVQTAKNRLGEWESRNREHLLEKERFDLRREEMMRQIEQAGRRPSEFANVAIREGMREGDLTEMDRRVFRLRGELASMGEVDQALMKEARDTEARYAFLTKESEDLEKAVHDLVGLMQDLSEKIKTEFDKSIAKINEEFNKFFALMFGGGTAKLKIEKPKEEKTEEEDEDGGEEEERDSAKDETEGLTEEERAVMQRDGGVLIDIKLPRKKITSLDMLSGGERSLVGIAALFAMVAVSPPPFLVLDEIDAPLDERNARRFGDMLKEFSKRTQFVVVTHNRATMEAADILYGVTLDEDGSSKVVSLKLEPAEAK
jgi:chromosome segregation protein